MTILKWSLESGRLRPYLPPSWAMLTSRGILRTRTKMPKTLDSKARLAKVKQVRVSAARGVKRGQPSSTQFLTRTKTKQSLSPHHLTIASWPASRASSSLELVQGSRSQARGQILPTRTTTARSHGLSRKSQVSPKGNMIQMTSTPQARILKEWR